MIFKRESCHLQILFIHLCFALSGKCADSFKILGVSVSSMKSHHSFFSGIMKGLADDGNNVTFFSPIEASEPIKNLREIQFDNPIDIHNSEGTD